MARPVSYPATLSITCRRCGVSYAPQFFRRNSRTCSACLDGTDPPSPADAMRVEVPAAHRAKRRVWPEGVVFTGQQPKAPQPDRPETCQWCNEPLPEPTPGPGRPKCYCNSTCRAAAVQPRRVLHALAKKSRMRR